MDELGHKCEVGRTRARSIRPVNATPRLLVATFGRLLAFDPTTGATDILHEGAGKYYGLAPATDDGPPAARLGVVSRPAAKDAPDRTDYLLEVDTVTRTIVRRRPIPTLDTHQMVRAGDRLLLTDTERGAIVVLAWPTLEHLRTIGGFTHENHVNSLYAEGRSLFAMCHNKGKSWMARIDVGGGGNAYAIAERWHDVGENAHDIAPFRDAEGDAFIVCDSKGGGILRVDRRTKDATRLWSTPGQFTKGLVVEDGIAWFGVSPTATRDERARVACDIVGLDITRGTEICRRAIDSRGLVNAIATSTSLERQRTAQGISA